LIPVSRRWPATAEEAAAVAAGVEDVAEEEAAVAEVVSSQTTKPLIIIPIQTDSVFIRLPLWRQLCTD
jgi:hypothetical protein